MPTPTHPVDATEKVHPLAIEAAEEIFLAASGEYSAALIITKTALLPVMEKGQEVASALEHFIVIQIVQTPGWLETAEGQSCQEALTQWRTMTNPGCGEAVKPESKNL
jgi:hypothetical protein